MNFLLKIINARTNIVNIMLDTVNNLLNILSIFKIFVHIVFDYF